MFAACTDTPDFATHVGHLPVCAHLQHVAEMNRVEQQNLVPSAEEKVPLSAFPAAQLTQVQNGNRCTRGEIEQPRTDEACPGVLGSGAGLGSSRGHSPSPHQRAHEQGHRQMRHRHLYLGERQHRERRRGAVVSARSEAEKEWEANMFPKLHLSAARRIGRGIKFLSVEKGRTIKRENMWIRRLYTLSSYQEISVRPGYF